MAYRRAWRIDRSQAGISLERIGAGRGQILDVEAGVGSVIHGYLHGGVPGNKVSSDGCPLYARGEIYPVRIPDGRVVLDDVAGNRGIDKPDPEVISLSGIPIPTEPVRTDPVAAGAASQSYAAAGESDISISHRNVAVDVVARSAERNNTREAVRGGGYRRHSGASAVKQGDTRPPKLPN